MEFSYSKYKKQTLVKMILVIIAIVLPIIAELALIPYYIQTFDNNENNAKGCAAILVVFVEVICIGKLISYIHIMTSKEYAEKFYIKGHDERLQLIDRKANTFTTLITLYIVGFAAAIAGCFNSTIFFTLLVVFFGIIIIYSLSYLYFMCNG